MYRSAYLRFYRDAETQINLQNVSPRDLSEFWSEFGNDRDFLVRVHQRWYAVSLKYKLVFSLQLDFEVKLAVETELLRENSNDYEVVTALCGVRLLEIQADFRNVIERAWLFVVLSVLWEAAAIRRVNLDAFDFRFAVNL